MELKLLKVDESFINSMDPVSYVDYFNNITIGISTYMHLFSTNYAVLPFKTR